MTEPITKQELIDASQDAETLKQCVNGSDTTEVTSRLGETFPSLSKAVKTLQDVGGFIGFTTKANLLAYVPTELKQLARVLNDTTANNGDYYWSGGVWTKSLFDPLTQALAGVNYGTNQFGAVTASATTVVVDCTLPSANAQDMPYIAWGERYTPAGVSFNAINLKTIAQTAALTTSQWDKLSIVVRTGANSHTSAATVIAVGSIKVNASLRTLTDVTILLKDPTTGAVKTLSNASFTGGEYFIGVYANNAVGGNASCGEPRGTMSNSMGQSYYNSGGFNSVTGTWLASVGGSNVRLGFRHVMLTSPVESTLYKATPAFAANVIELETAVGKSNMITANQTAITYAINQFGAISASSTAVNLDCTAPSSQAQDLPFMGWGERYTPAGVSFNAININTIAQTAALTSSQWDKLLIVVRTGATSNTSAGIIVAVGSIKVNSNLRTLTNVTILLRDPTTNAVKTLNDASFSGGEYFIGVYAQNAAGGFAACGEPRGTLTNAIGQTYYSSSVSGQPALTGNWNTAIGGSNVRLGFRHLLLTAPVESVAFAPNAAFSNASAALVTSIAPEIVMPAFIFGVQGREANVYFDNLFLSLASQFFVNADTSAAIGVQQTDRFTWTPAGAVTSGTLTVNVCDKNSGTKLVTKVANLRAAASSAGTGMTKKVLCIGDSLMQAGVITQTLLDIASTDVMAVMLLGTQGTGLNKHEGRGGWKVSDYTTIGRTYYSFTVTGVTVAPSINATTYTHNGATYMVQTNNLSGGSGTIICSVVSGGAPLASGTLTKSNGSAGDATITFSASAAVPGNPFWISGALNFAQYLTNNSVSVPDWVIIELGINDIFAYVDDALASSFADAQFTALDALIASIKAADANVKIGLMIPTPPCFEQNGFGYDYGVGQTQFRYKRNILIWARQLILKYAGQEASRIYIVPSNTALDTVHNYATQSTAANSRNSTLITRQASGVHPAPNGYQQIGDALWAFLKYYA